jgi:hypothetical protein
MKRFCFLIALLSILSVNTVSAEDSIEFQSFKRPSLLITRDYPQIYRPARIYIGKENKFTIKAEAGSFVSIALSLENKGSELFYGHSLRLGKDIVATGEGKVPANGLLEITVKMPYDKKLDGKSVYFEGAVWKNEDFSDLKIANIISPSGRESDSNQILLAMPVKDSSGLSLMPSLPGASTEFVESMKTINEIRQNETQGLEKDYEYNMDDMYRKPLMLRNLDAPDMNTKQ